MLLGRLAYRLGSLVRRLVLGLVGALAAVATGLLLAGPIASAPVDPPERAPLTCDAEARAAGTGVGVVIAFPGRSLFTACVAAGGSGIDVLRRAGLAPVIYGFGSEGGAVCALTDPRSGEQVGCAAGPNCLLCAKPEYWEYQPGYRYSPVGAGSTRPGSGTIEAWQWGSATSWAGARTYDVCQPPPPPARPPSTPPPPPVSTAPPSGPGGTEGAAGPTAPGPAAPSPGGLPSAPETPSGEVPPPPDGPGPASPTTERDGSTPTTPSTTTPASSSSSTTTTTSTTRPDGTGPDDPEADPEQSTDDVAADDGDERAQAPPDGSMSVREDGGGGPGALVGVAATGGVVGLLSVVAVRARRRWNTAEDPPRV